MVLLLVAASCGKTHLSDVKMDAHQNISSKQDGDVGVLFQLGLFNKDPMTNDRLDPYDCNYCLECVCYILVNGNSANAFSQGDTIDALIIDGADTVQRSGILRVWDGNNSLNHEVELF